MSDAPDLDLPGADTADHPAFAPDAIRNPLATPEPPRPAPAGDGAAPPRR